MSDAANIKQQRGTALVVRAQDRQRALDAALAIAARAGRHVVCEPHELLEDDFGLAELLHCAPETIVVEGFPTRPRALRRLKHLVTSDKVEVHRKGLWPTVERMPNIILATGSADCLRIDEQSRRFIVVEA